MGRRGKGSMIVGEIGAHPGGTRGSGKGGRKELVTSAYLGESECYGSWGIEESVPCNCVLCVCVSCLLLGSQSGFLVRCRITDTSPLPNNP